MSNADSLAPPQDYLKTYSLRCEPFANTLDGRFFYGGAALMQRLDLLTHLTQFGESVILVSGPRGSGKTTLLSRFVAQTGKQWRLCLLNADEFVQFRQRLGDALGIGDVGDEQQMLEQWASQNDVSQLLVIVIDNTQQLQPDALQKLCALLSQPQGDRTRLIMFGTPEAQQALKQALDQKNLPCSAQLLDIPKLSEEETASYLMYRLAVAGYSGESPFTATEVRAICKAADGRPAEINRLAHDALLEHQMRALSKRLHPRRKTWLGNRAIWGMASLLVAGFALYLGWERRPPEPIVDKLQEQREAAPNEIPLPLPEPAPSTPAARPMAAVPPATTPGTPLPASDIVEQPPPQVPATPTVSTPPQPEPAPVAHRPAMKAVEKTLPSLDVAAATPTAAAKPPPQPPAEAPAEAPVTAPGTAAKPASGTEPRKITAAVATEPATATSATTPAAQPDGAPAPHREDWLLQQSTGRYSLQLLGSRQEDSILQYIEQNKLDPQRCAYYRGTFKGGDWYVLVYGVFADRESALAARSALPARVQKEKPWPRSLASVHTAISEAR